METANITIEQWPIDKLLPYVGNPRKNDHAVERMATAIKEFGFRVPIVALSDGSIIDGHLRIKAASHLGIETVPVIKADNMTDEQIKAFRISVNRMAELADWDLDQLKMELEDLQELDFDLELTGLDTELIDGLMQDIKGTEGNTDPDAVPDPPKDPITKPNDLWKLGRHRLLCGDSTIITDVERLMDGKKVDMVFTAPPYNVAFNGRSGKHDIIKNDDLDDNDFACFIDEVCQTISTVNASIYYIWCNWKFYGILQEKLPYKACIVWAKNVFGLSVGYRHQHEFCLFNGKIDEAIKNESDLWEIKKDTNYVHPTQKPVELCERALSNHSNAQNILDLFLGSGSTLIACEQSGRVCYGMELDPKYCDVIVKRWEDFTGQKAELLSK